MYSALKEKVNFRFFWVAILMLLFSHSSHAQSNYPLNYFGYPMDTPIILSGVFGSLRDNHFHSGMDLRTYEKEGLPVYAIADGYVARIKYASNGYGKAIYINHPNGYTSVYGHLQNANASIADYIKRYHYEIKQFEFDHFLTNNKLPVKKGDIIGWSGNTGASSGPHVHFEIRHTQSEQIINPLLFGLSVMDTLNPQIKGIALLLIKEAGGEQLQYYPLYANNTLSNDSGIILLDTLKAPNGTIGFGVEAIDYLTDRTTPFGLYGLELFIDHQKYFQFKLDRFAFNESRTINRFIDYAYYKKGHNRIQKLYLEDGSRNELHKYTRDKGRYYLNDTLVHQLKITAFDFENRRVNVFAYFKGSSGLDGKTIPNINTIRCFPNKENVFKNDLIKVTIPKNALYDTLNLEYALTPMEKNALSEVHQIHDCYTPLNKQLTIAIKPSIAVADRLTSKCLLGYAPLPNQWRSIGGEFEAGYVIARNNALGYYRVMIDTLPPTIKMLPVIQNKTTGIATISFTIKDELSGIASYQLFINGKWMLAEYDAKNDLVEYFMDENTPQGKLQLELIVKDKKDNQTVYKSQLNN